MQHIPEAFPRRVLVAVCGLSPQILTETLYALAVASQPSFVPTEIHLLTTREGAHRAHLTLLHPDSGKFRQLCRDYGLPKIAFDADHVHVIADPDGDELDDIRSPQENEYLADHITQAIRQYTLDPQAALHVSMAGGRKTMGYYAGYALSLFGRQQDRLSHVLVTPDYEGNPDFFYPTPTSQVIYTRDNRPLDSAKAEVTLAQIPFIRLREDIPERLLNGQAGFSETIAFALRANEAPQLVINRAMRELSANGLAIHLPDSLLAFYFWVVRHSVLDEKPLPKPDKGNEGNREYAAEFLRHYQDLVDPMRDTDKTEDALRHGMDEAFFQEKVSRINTALKKELGERLAKKFCIVNRGRRNSSDYGLELSADQIQII
jgi:CRISPR-associated protein (TIGR02584 family)